MAPARGGFCPLLLLLLLGLWVAEDPVSARPRNMTPAQWFETQHVQPSPQGCSTTMHKINNFCKCCKDFNTFLHESFSSVTTSCQTSNTACKNGCNNCHQSQMPVSLTECKLTSERDPECKYNEEERNASYIVACDPPEKKDSKKFKLVCVHLDKIPLSMNVSTFLAYDQPTISYCGVHHELLSHKSFETNAQEDTMETHLETELDLSTITAAARITDHKQPLA